MRTAVLYEGEGRCQSINKRINISRRNCYLASCWYSSYLLIERVLSFSFFFPLKFSNINNIKRLPDLIIFAYFTLLSPPEVYLTFKIANSNVACEACRTETIHQSGLVLLVVVVVCWCSGIVALIIIISKQKTSNIINRQNGPC